MRAVLIDDEADIRMLTKLSLEIEAHADIVGEADDGAGGLDLIEQLSPDVAIIDLHLPDISGVDIIRLLRARNIKVTRLVAYSADDIALQAAVEAGADAAVRKTGDVEHLVEAVTNEE